jgi:hypothetical protein
MSTAIPRLQQSPELGGAPVAESSAPPVKDSFLVARCLTLSTSKHGSHPLPVHRNPAMTDRVDALVHSIQAAYSASIRDCIAV